MHILASRYPRTSLVPTSPNVVEVGYKDMRFLYDTNSMALAMLDPQERAEDAVAKCTDPMFGFTGAPVFGLGPAGKAVSVILNVTLKCPQRCKYCFQFQHLQEAGTGTMDPNMACNFIQDYMDPSPSIDSHLGFFGGEPLMAWKEVVEISKFYIDWIKRCEKKRWNLHVTTNAVLMTEEKAKFLAENNFSFIVSLDGPKEMHDRYRIFPDGSGTHDAVMKGLEIMKKHGLTKRCTLRSTFTCREGGLVERLEFLNNLCAKGYGTHVSVEPVFATESNCSHLPEDAGELAKYEMEAMDAEYEKAVVWYIQRHLNNKFVRFHHFDHPVRRLLYSQISFHECGAGRGYLSLNPDGSIAACHRTSHTKLGNMREGIDPVKREPWLDNRFTCRMRCRSCYGNLCCGGGCRENNILYTGNINEPLDISCKFTLMRMRAAMYIIATLGPKLLRTKVKE